MRAMEYIKEKKLTKSQKEAVMKLVETMNSLGLSDEGRLQTITIGEINYVHGGEISEHGIEMLEQKFGIKSEIVPIQSGILNFYQKLLLYNIVIYQVSKFTNLIC